MHTDVARFQSGTITVNGVRLYHEEHGTGDPILCVHGSPSSAAAWGAAFGRLAELGRVIAYDRRGYWRSERREPLETSVETHADDAAALLEALDPAPAIVIGRSSGGEVATALGLRHPEQVRALVLLEASLMTLDAGAMAYIEELRLVAEAAASKDISTVADALLRNVLGDETWDSFPEDVRDMFADGAAPALAEFRGPAFEVTADDLARIRVPTLLVAAASSHPSLRRVTELMAAAIPGSRMVVVEGGHLIDPAGPEVLAFIREVLGR
jgi:esterase